MAEDKEKKLEAEEPQQETAPDPELPAEENPAPEAGGEPQPTAEAEEENKPTAEEWQKALETAVKQRDEYLALAQRAQADFQNFKRRNASVRTDAYDDGVREALAALLPSLDNLERAIEASRDVPEDDPLRSGVAMTLKQMQEAMGKLGLSPVGEKGERFDPDKHNAVARAEGEGEPGTVLEVFQKGYRVKDRMIRYAMVKIEAEG